MPIDPVEQMQGKYEEERDRAKILEANLFKAEKKLSEMEQRLEAAVAHSEHVEVERDKLEIELQEQKCQLEYYKGFSDAVKLICGGGG